MKHLNFDNKIIFLINSLVAFLLLISYVLPYIPPKSFATLSVLSLGVPLLILLNVLCFTYWLFRVKKQLLLSLIVLLLGWNHIKSMYKFSSSENTETNNSISVMSFNVRLFNLFDWLPGKTVKDDILNFIATEQPDVLCVQEYHQKEQIKIKGYSKYELFSKGKIKSGQAIFSKYTIINSGSVEFPNTANNAIFIDILKEKDTLRIYNLHLQSTGINTDLDQLKKEASQDLFNQVSTTFKAQQTQADLFIKHKSKCNYKVIIAGDFNNTAYSYVYKKIKEDLVDAFEVAGSGFGRTYDFKFFPVRIDFILADPTLKVNGFKTFDVKLSDHFPIMTTLKLH